MWTYDICCVSTCFWVTYKTQEFVDDDGLYKYDDFGFIGFDLWQVKGSFVSSCSVLFRPLKPLNTLKSLI